MPKAPSVRKAPRKEAKVPRKKRAVKNEETVASSAGLAAPACLSAAAPTPGPSTGAVLARTVCTENVLERYPGIEVRSDFDLAELSSQSYKGTPAEIYASLDERFAEDVEEFGYEEAMEMCTRFLDTYVEPTGVKPKASATENKFVLVRPISDSEYSVRLFPGSISAAEYCMDFIETATGKPVNSPFEYELWGIPNPDADTPWLSIPMVGKLRSIERGFRIKQEEIEPGAEKFVLRDGQTCVLMRPGKRPIRFTVPVRKMKAPEVVEDVEVLDFPRYIEA